MNDTYMEFIRILQKYDLENISDRLKKIVEELNNNKKFLNALDLARLEVVRDKYNYYLVLFTVNSDVAESAYESEEEVINRLEELKNIYTDISKIKEVKIR